jgi:hypothetical protein
LYGTIEIRQATVIGEKYVRAILFVQSLASFAGKPIAAVSLYADSPERSVSGVANHGAKRDMEKLSVGLIVRIVYECVKGLGTARHDARVSLQPRTIRGSPVRSGRSSSWRFWTRNTKSSSESPVSATKRVNRANPSRTARKMTFAFRRNLIVEVRHHRGRAVVPLASAGEKFVPSSGHRYLAAGCSGARRALPTSFSRSVPFV